MSLVSNEEWLMAWLCVWCDEDWEHSHGVSIQTLVDGPGWSLVVDLEDTALEAVPLQKAGLKRAADDWIEIWVTEKQFHGRGGIWNLDELVETFRLWVQGIGPTFRLEQSGSRFLADLDLDAGAQSPSADRALLQLESMMIRSYACREPHAPPRVKLETTDDPGWSVTIRTAVPCDGGPALELIPPLAEEEHAIVETGGYRDLIVMIQRALEHAASIER